MMMESEPKDLIGRVRLEKQDRFVEIVFSLRPFYGNLGIPVGSEELTFEVAPVEEGGRRPTFADWSVGILQGAFSTFRALEVPMRQVIVHRLLGRLAATDKSAVSTATILGICNLLGRDDLEPELGGWSVVQIGPATLTDDAEPAE